MPYKAIIAGATGLIGSNLLDILLKEQAYSEVIILVRKETGLQHKKLHEVIVDFDRLDEAADMINGHAVFCCLGSTKKKTPDLKVYYKIDHDYPLQLARLALKNNVDQYHLVSSIGANAAASNFYLKMKGETEADIKGLGLRALHIYRPSQLTGSRKEHRPFEKAISVLMQVIGPLLIGGLKKYRSIPAKTVAQAMYNGSLNKDKGVFIHPSDNIKQIA